MASLKPDRSYAGWSALVAFPLLVCTMVAAFSNDTPPWAYRHLQDQAMPLLTLGLAQPCRRDPEGLADKLLSDLECYRFDAPKRMSGLWVARFEHSTFEPGDGSPNLWFSPPDTLKPLIGRGLVFKVDFIGRVTAVDGRYGHFGGWHRMVIVDRMISMQPNREG